MAKLKIDVNSSSNTSYNKAWVCTIFRFDLYRLGLYIIFLIPFFAVFAQLETTQGLSPNKRPSQYIIRSWDTEDGLTSESTNDLIQTPDGYIWIATYTGLHRFDGNKFTLFSYQNSALPSSNVLTMGMDSHASLWLGTLHGIANYSEGVITVPKALESVSGYSIETLLVTSKDDIWFSTKSNQLYLFSNGVLENFTSLFRLEQSTVLTIAEGQFGIIYFGTDDSKLISYSIDKGVENLLLPEDVNGISKLTPSSNQLYIGTGKGLYILNEKGLSKEPYLENTAIMSLLVDPTGMLWLGTMKGLFRYDWTAHEIDSLTESSGLPNNIIRDILLDQRGNLWGGTYRSGLFFLSDGSLTSYSKNDGLFTDIITGITEIKDGTYLLGNENGKLNQLQNGKISDYTPPVPLPNARLKHLFTDSKGRVWASTYAGLVLFNGDHSRVYTTETGFPDNFIRMVFEDDQGYIWVGTKNAGLIRFSDPDHWKMFNIENGMSSDYIMSINQNRKGELVVGTISGINIIKDLKVVKKISVKDGLPSNFSFTTYSTSNYLWIASNDGLTAYSEDTVVTFNSEIGLHSNIIYDILADSDGYLWLPSEKAIMKVSLEDLENQISGQTSSLVYVEQFDKVHGMKNNHCLGAVLSYKDAHGDFWIPTLGGVVNLKPGEIRSPHYYGNTIIESISSDNQKLDQTDPIVIPSESNHLSIEFTGINFVQSEKLQFRYMLRPFDNQWILASGERSARYTNLHPGNYEFVLQAGFDNQFFDPATRRNIQIKAAWWQTIWAKVFYVLLAISIGFIIYWIRLSSLTSRNHWLGKMVESRTAELERQKLELMSALEKLSAAQEQVLHSEKMASLGVLAAGVAHEINNPLNFIMSGSHLLQRILSELETSETQITDPNNREDVKLLLQNINLGTERIKQIVSSLSSFSRGNQDEFKSCNVIEIIENSLTILHHEYRHRIVITRKFQNHEMKVWGNESKLYQVFTNLISNSIHSIEGEGEIVLEVTYEFPMTKIVVLDSGKGIPKEVLPKVFDPFFTTKEVGKGTGLGLSIIYNIVSEHKGEIKITSEETKGTEVLVLLPMEGESVLQE